MAIDPYSPCPGGLGKKVKFCCADLVSDLDKIDRMRQAEQRSACLEHVEKLDAKHPGRACLMTAKADLLRELGRTQEADVAVKSMLDQHADNPVALAEAAILTCDQPDGALPAIGLLQRALAGSSANLSDKVVEALARVSESLLGAGLFLPARAHLLLYMALNPEDKNGLELLTSMDRAPAAPLQLKERFEFKEPPQGASWQGNFVDAMEPIQRGCWAQAADRLTLLAKRVPDAAAAWHNLAVLAGWLGQSDEAADAWRHYASQDIPSDDAVEAEAVAQVLDPTPLDEIDIVAVSYQIHDMDRLLEVLLSHPNCISWPPRRTSEDPESPPPKAAFGMFDRPMPAEGASLTLADVPRLLGDLEIYGRQTDREAYLELVGERMPYLDQAKGVLADLGFGLLGPPEEEVIAALPKVDVLLRGNLQLPATTPVDRIHELVVAHRRDVLANQWPRLPLQLFDGQTPEQAARQPGMRLKVMAALLNLEIFCQGKLYEFDFNELRTRLGLPIPEPITVAGEELLRLPLMRLSRVVTDPLSDADLSKYFVRAVSTSAIVAWRKALLAATARPNFKQALPPAMAYAGLASLCEDTREALTYIERARQAAIADKESTAQWDLQEIQIRLRRGEAVEVSRLMEHVAKEHGEEPGVRQALMQIMVQLGMIRPDGTPTRAAQQTPGLVGAAASSPTETGKIWTPDSERTGGEKKSGLWLPGS